MRAGLNIRVFSVLVFLLVVQNPLLAQTLTLDSVFKIIVRQQPELKVYDSQIKAYETYASGARSLDPPQVGAGLFMTPYNTMMWKPDPMTGSPGMGSFMISAQQMFMNPKKLNANATYMNSMAQVDKEMKGVMQNDLFSMAKMNYYEWQLLKRKLKVLTESEELLNYLVKSTEIRYSYGMDKLNGYYKAKAMLGDMQNMKLMTELEIKQMRINLNTLMNRNKDIPFDIDTTLQIKNYENTMVDTSQISSQRSDYKVYSQNINLLKSKQLYERSKRLPDFGIKYDHMLAFGTQPQQFSLMAMVSIPIVPWSSKMYKSSIVGLNYEMEAFKNRQDVIINQTAGELQKIQAEIKNKKVQLALYENTIMSSMKKNYQISLLAYEQNTEELFMVLDAWANLKTSQLGYLDLLKDLLLLQAQYEKQLEIK
jgi:outer membrane protein TolC